MKTKPGSPVCVHWLDAASSDDNVTPDNLAGVLEWIQDFRRQSYGVLVEHTDVGVTIAHHDDGPRGHQGLLFVPAGMVQKVVALRPVRARAGRR